MADLATEPRWGRINGTFGEDADLSAAMTKAYILGFQGDSLGAHSVACMTKHFAGSGINSTVLSVPTGTSFRTVLSVPGKVGEWNN